MDDPQSQPMEPYRPPAAERTAVRDPNQTGRKGTHPLLEPLTIAFFLWAALAVTIVVVGFLLRPMFDEFGLELPLTTRFLLHPIASVCVMATAVVVILSGIAIDNQVKRNRLGWTAVVLALLAFAVSMFGYVMPLISATWSLA